MNIRKREAKVVFAGIAPISKGTAVHLEYPRTGKKLGAVAEDEMACFNPNRIRLPSANVTYTAREADRISGPFQWNGRSQGLIEVVVRSCEVDMELGQTLMEVDVVAERQVTHQGQVMTHVPLW